MQLTFDHFGLDRLIRVHCSEPIAHGDQLAKLGALDDVSAKNVGKRGRIRVDELARARRQLLESLVRGRQNSERSGFFSRKMRKEFVFC